jgi:hypothetical protein
MGILVECHLHKVLHEEAGDDQTQWWTHSHAVNLFIRVASETEVWGCQDMAEEPQDTILKTST